MLVLHYTGMARRRRRRWSGCAIRPPKCRRITPSTRTARFMPTCLRRAAPGMRAFLPGRARATSMRAPSASNWSIPAMSSAIAISPIRRSQALITLCHGILLRHPIPSARVLGHSDVAPARKEDPGELFPWERLAKAGIGLWPQIARQRSWQLMRSRDTAMTRCAAGKRGHGLPAPFPSQQNWTEYGMGNAPACWLALLIKLSVNAGHVSGSRRACARLAGSTWCQMAG